jgi:activator of 2-hydroxyglutaryl-CoA dehydratase
MALRVGIVPEVAMSGGVALNIGMVKAMAEELGQPIRVHPDCQLAGAIGAAILAWQKA